MASISFLPWRWPSQASSRRVARRIAASLLRNRHVLARRLWESLAGWRKYDSWNVSNAEELDARVKREFHVFVDYLRRYYATGDEVYKQLYVGEKLKQLYDRSLDPEREFANRRRVTEADIEILCGSIRAELGAEAAEFLESLLRDVQRVVLARGRKHLEVLWIGDCLFLDVRGFLAAQALEDGITFEPTFVGTRNPVEQRDRLRALAGRHFDAIFYSPVTYEFSWDLNAYLKVGRWMTSRNRVGQTLSSAMDQIDRTLDVLATSFDVPIYIHNTAHVRRHDSTPAELAKVWLTRRVRRLVREGVNARLEERIAAWRAADANLMLFDEIGILARYGDVALGRYVYPTKIQHPAEMGQRVADGYRDILATLADLAGKKVVVCDLDNTLWKGEIGEGAVEHFAGIQGALKALRHKGVLLSVNSKNDRRNVRWDGAILSEDDFVHMEINWDSKVANMHRIQQALNLKFKDFVFLDDRADQRALIREALPEICVLDATSPRLAKRLAYWAATLTDNPQTDRTRQYREREQRESFLSESAAPAEDPASAFARLEIRVEIRDARPSELKRVAELINRTNQFNLAGSRTSVTELRKWHAAPGRRIVVADARDRFGPMGMVGALVLDENGPEIQIPVFVLSCRVFGYGIEDAMLNAVKRLARARTGHPGWPIRGAYVETPNNGPCRDMYPRHGFIRDGESWALAQIDAPGHPVWLTVVDALS